MYFHAYETINSSDSCRCQGLVCNPGRARLAVSPLCQACSLLGALGLLWVNCEHSSQGGPDPWGWGQGAHLVLWGKPPGASGVAVRRVPASVAGPRP